MTCLKVTGPLAGSGVAEKRLRAHLTDKGIGNEVYYPVPFHKQDCFQYLDYAQGQFLEAENAAEQTIAVPIYPELTHEMQDYVVDQVTEYYA